jgi:Domain of unknown function (DUF4304)
MTELPAKKLVDEIVKRGLQPHLKAAGYKKKARTFFRELDGGVFQIVNVQLSQWGTATESKFTINLGVFFPSIQQISLKPALDGVPNEYDCHLRQRIGMLMPDHLDHWWTVTSNPSIDGVAQQISEAWSMYGQQWIERCSHLELIEDKDMYKSSVIAMMIAIALSDKATAKAMHKQMYKNVHTTPPSFRLYLEQLGKAHGLLE